MNNTEAVVLPAGYTGSSLFHSVLTQTAARYPNVFASVAPPTSAAAFKRDYGTILARFEAARVRAPERVAIAREIVRVAQEALQFGVEGTTVPLREYLRERAPAPVLERSAGFGSGLPIELPFEGRTYRGKQGIEVLDRLRQAYQLSEGAYAALKWIMEQEHVDLRGERFVLLGAGAELAPTEFLLRAGAEVLWIDVSDPGRARALGSLTHAPGVGNLLEQPREIAAAIRAFADGAPVHIGMYAYAPGASKEWRLGAAMNAIVASLEPALLRSVSLLISPTTPAVLSEDTLQAAELRKANSPLWQRLLTRSGLTVEPGWLRFEDTCISLSTVALQGLSYQAAQYISKIAAAEMYAVYGTALPAEAPRPLKVSANVAGITRTRSLSHPLFNAAFLGASQFGVRIFDPATTRALSGLLMLHDLLNPSAPTARAESALDKARAVSSQPIHGGIYGLPWELEGVIRVAAVVGLANRPTILLEKPAPSIAVAE
ncbi:MAG TPA: hypothetical protein VI299_26905 [Polyangiales bacterium]